MWLFKRKKPVGTESGNVNAFFMRVGNAMAVQIFNLICRKCKGEVALVRLLSADYVTADERAGPEDTTEGFAAITYHDTMLQKPEEIKSVKGAFRAFSPSYDSTTPIVLIVANEKWGTNARSWVQTFNSQYMKAGALPIVRLVICNNVQSGAALSACFDIAVKDPDWENRFTKWCASANVDFSAWATRKATQAKRAPSRPNLELQLALLEASSKGDMSKVQELLNRSADPNIHYEAGKHHGAGDRGLPPLFLAAENGHADVVRLLLAAGADPEWKRAEGETALHRAASRRGGAGAVQALLQAGVNPNIEYKDWGRPCTPLRCAVHADDKETISLLESAGAKYPGNAIASFCGKCGQSITAIPDWPFRCPACGAVYPNWRPPDTPPRKVDIDAMKSLAILVKEWRELKARDEEDLRLYGSTPATLERFRQSGRRQKEVCEAIADIGAKLHAIGGMTLMVDTWKALDQSSFISSCWHCIGEWQY